MHINSEDYQLIASLWFVGSCRKVLALFIFNNNGIPLGLQRLVVPSLGAAIVHLQS